MKNTFKYIIASVAALAFSMTAFAADDETKNWSAIKTTKNATANSDGSFTLTLDTFVTGEHSFTSETKPQPINAVLVLDDSGSMTDPISSKDATKRVTALIEASKVLVRMITKDAVKNGVDHKISIVKFSGGTGYNNYKNINDSYILNNLTNVRTKDSTALLNSLTYNQYNKNTYTNYVGNSLIAAGYTAAEAGLANANTVLAKADEGALKLVIMFTDGEPNHGTGFDTTVANSAIKNAKTIKSSGAEIYSISVVQNPTSDMNKYLNFVSSNYKEASSMTDGGAYYDSKATNPNAATVLDPYYKLATNTSQLTNIFKEITNNTLAKAGADISLTPSDVTLKDIVSESFMLPNGADASAIKLYTSDCIGVASDGTRLFSNDREVCTDVTPVVDGKTVTVNGFDFSDNWCGLNQTLNESNQIVNGYHGKKLIIEFKIVPDPNAEGGLVTTNDPESGVIVNGENAGAPVVKYPVPTRQFTPMDLKITKTGLKAGDSSIFKITRKDGDGNDDSSFTMNVVLTSTSDNAASTTLTKLPVNDANGKPYVYKVVETGWAWNYTNNVTVGSSNEHALYTMVNDEFNPTNVFSFTASQEAGAPTNNAEAYKKNEFKTRN